MTAPGWYPDPTRIGGRRWWDGERWTELSDQAGSRPGPDQAAGPTSAPPSPARLVAAMVVTVSTIVAFGLGLGVGRWSAPEPEAPTTTLDVTPYVYPTDPSLPPNEPIDPPVTESTTTTSTTVPPTVPRVGPPGAPVFSALPQEVRPGYVFTCPRWDGATPEHKAGPGRELAIRSATLVRAEAGLCIDLDLGDGLLFCADPFDDHAIYIRFQNEISLKLYCSKADEFSVSVWRKHSQQLELQPTVGAAGVEGNLVLFAFVAPAPAAEMLTGPWSVDYN